MKGDCREEVILASGDKLYIYSNAEPTRFPQRASLRSHHDYLMNLASIGTELPKP